VALGLSAGRPSPARFESYMFWDSRESPLGRRTQVLQPSGGDLASGGGQSEADSRIERPAEPILTVDNMGFSKVTSEAVLYCSENRHVREGSAKGRAAGLVVPQGCLTAERSGRSIAWARTGNVPNACPVQYVVVRTAPQIRSEGKTSSLAGFS
jgi:hypothetical protein